MQKRKLWPNDRYVGAEGVVESVTLKPGSIKDRLAAKLNLPIDYYQRRVNQQISIPPGLYGVCVSGMQSLRIYPGSDFTTLPLRVRNSNLCLFSGIQIDRQEQQVRSLAHISNEYLGQLLQSQSSLAILLLTTHTLCFYPLLHHRNSSRMNYKYQTLVTAVICGRPEKSGQLLFPVDRIRNYEHVLHISVRTQYLKQND